jgi:hypothetical protein
LIIFGQILTLWGTALGWRAVHVDEDKAIELGASRWVGDTKKERLKTTPSWRMAGPIGRPVLASHSLTMMFHPEFRRAFPSKAGCAGDLQHGALRIE